MPRARLINPRQTETVSQWTARRDFLNYAADVYPEILTSLQDLVLPLARANDTVDDLRCRSQSALAQWGDTFGLSDEWALERAVFTVLSWARGASASHFHFPEPPSAVQHELLTLTAGWDGLRESEAQFRDRALKEHYQRVNAYVAATYTHELHHLLYRPEPRREHVREHDERLRWLAEIHCNPRRDVSARAIATRLGVRYSTLKEQLKRASEFVQLSQRRRARPGRRRGYGR